MYKDNSLVPSEAIRLAALGLLGRGPRAYGDLAREIRHFAQRIVGPSLELLGPSLELFKIEGMIEAQNPMGNPKAAPDEQIMVLTEAGHAELRRLMTANLRGPLGEVNKLIIALKLHFFESLTPEERRAQAEMLEEACERELTRLVDLRQFHADSGGLLVAWLDHEIAEIESRRDWFKGLAAAAQAH
jgi:DNA-binding PadR family transcriptional regulator